MTFGLNALHGKHQISHNVWEGAWDPTNAYDFIKYTVSKGYKIDSWELGRTTYKKWKGYLLRLILFDLTLFLNLLL